MQNNGKTPHIYICVYIYNIYIYNFRNIFLKNTCKFFDILYLVTGLLTWGKAKGEGTGKI